MTTIAWDTKTLAGDGRVTQDTVIITENMVKVKRYEVNGTEYLVGGAGVYAELMKFWQWASEGFKEEDKELFEFGEHFTGIVIINGTELKIFEDGTFLDFPNEIHAVGSGADMAIAAMLAGKKAPEAIVIASKIDSRSNGNITSVKTNRLNKPKVTKEITR